MGKTCVVPLRVLMATQRLSQLKEMSCTLADVAPRYSWYRWWTAASLESQGWGTKWNTLKVWPSVLAVTRRVPLERERERQRQRFG